MGAYLSAIGTGVGSLLMTKFGRNTSVSAEELRVLSTGLELGKPETIYLETVCALMEAGDNISEQTGRDILSTLGTLLEQARYVNERLERLRKATGAESAADLVEQRERMAGRLAQVEDAQARQDLTQSLAMCDERLRNAKELSPLLERLDAQWEVIEQTLLSVQGSVSRLQIAPTALTAPDVEEVKRVVDHITTQTQAVEDAVQQVMSLRA
jgi:DNA repair exonuclease SbcCD ATPase subunit